jgi:ribosomal protein S18 acetylase RimI-like enzyme
MVKVFPADSDEHFQLVRDLTRKYIAWDVSRTAELGLDPNVLMEFQYAQGGERLPGDFSPPEGCLLLATFDGNAAGCGAFHKLAPSVCEMKRVYVRPEFRGRGIGRDLATHLVSTARKAGYASMRLETVTFMDTAIALYESLGFHRIDPYYEIPTSFLPITVFMELDLHAPGLSAA